MLQQDYIIYFNEKIYDTKTEKPGGQAMTPENLEKLNFLIDFKWNQWEREERQTNPGAYLLTEKEKELIERAFACFVSAFTQYENQIEDKTELAKFASKIAIIDIKSKKINLKKLRGIIERYTTALFWSMYPQFVTVTDKNGVKITTSQVEYKIAFSDIENEEYKTIKLEEKHPFFTAETMQERLRALGFSDLYLYVTKFELDALELLQRMFVLYDAEQTGSETQKPGMMLLKSAPEFDFFMDTSIKALQEAKASRKLSTEGEQITVFDILTKQGIELETENTIDDILAFKNPNSDKLFKQVMREAIRTKQRTITITLNSFMQARGLKDRKEAKRQLVKAANALFDVKIKLKAKKGKQTQGRLYTRVFSSVYVPGQNGAESGSVIIDFDEAFFDTLLKNNQVIYMPEKILKISSKKPDAYFFACKFLQRKRMQNNQRSELDNRLSVITLLDVSTIPSYEELKEKWRFRQLIIDRFENALDYLELPEDKGGVGLFSYYFTKEKGQKLTKAELSLMRDDFEFFKSLYVNVVWYDDIDYTSVKEKHQKHNVKRAAAKAKAEAKKQTAAAAADKKPAKKKSSQDPKPQKQTPKAPSAFENL